MCLLFSLTSTRLISTESLEVRSKGSLNRRLEIVPAVELLFTRHLIGHRRKRISGRIQQGNEAIQLLCKLQDARRQQLIRHPTIRATVTRTNRNSHRVQGFEFADQGAEVGKIGNAFASKFVLPLNCLDDLADDLRQPTQRMGFVQRDRIGPLFQKVATLTDPKNGEATASFSGITISTGRVLGSPRSGCCDTAVSNRTRKPGNSNSLRTSRKTSR